LPKLAWASILGALAAVSFAPPGLAASYLSHSHGLRRGLHSFAAARLLLEDFPEILTRCGMCVIFTDDSRIDTLRTGCDLKDEFCENPRPIRVS
jgi:hypothetical protein